METGRVLRKRKGRAEVKATMMASWKKLKRQRASNQKSAGDLTTKKGSHIPVEISFCNVDGRKFTKQAQVNLLSHCVFCLRKIHQPTETFQDVPTAQLTNPSSSFLCSFNCTWSYLKFKNGQGKGGEKEHDLLIADTCTDKTPTKFLDVPDMCKFCSEKMKTVHRLFTELETQLDALEKLVEKAIFSRKYSWRVTLNNSNLRKEVIDASLDLFHAIGTKSAEDSLGSDAECGQKVDDNVPSSKGESAQKKKFFVSVCWEEGPNSQARSEHQGKQLEEAENENIDDDGGILLGEEEVSDTSDLDPDYIKSEPESDFSEMEPFSSDKEMSKSKKENIFPSDNNTQTSRVEREQMQENGTCSTSDDPETKKGQPVSSKPNLNHCEKCGKSFSSFRNFKLHKRTVQCDKKRPSRLSLQNCDLCNAPVPIADIYKHVRAHVGEEYLLKCPNPKCPHVYSSAKSLRHHLRKTTNRAQRCKKCVPNLSEYFESFNVCKVCGHKATTLSGLRGHLSRVHENPAQKNFPCPIQNCPHAFTVKQSVVCHLQDHDMLSHTQSCCECDSTLKFEEMEQHLKETHEAEEVIKCHHCPFQFSTREFMLDHLHEHKWQGPLSCGICKDHPNFHQYATLREHYLKKHGVGRKYSCADCGYVSWTLDLAEQHNKKQHSVGNAEVKKTYVCNLCNATFATAENLSSHNIREHSAQPYRCHLCSATFSSSYSLRRHEREHGGGSLEEFRCDVEGCGKVFKKNKNLQIHVKSTHSGRGHVCELCGNSYKSTKGLACHKTSFHLGLRNFICELCGERFTTSSFLRRHNLIHTGERPYFCDICGQRFRTTNVLKTHLESHRKKGADFKPTGPMKHVRKRVERISRLNST